MKHIYPIEYVCPSCGQLVYSTEGNPYNPQNKCAYCDEECVVSYNFGNVTAIYSDKSHKTSFMTELNKGEDKFNLTCMAVDQRETVRKVILKNISFINKDEDYYKYLLLQARMNQLIKNSSDIEKIELRRDWLERFIIK